MQLFASAWPNSLHRQSFWNLDRSLRMTCRTRMLLSPPRSRTILPAGHSSRPYAALLRVNDFIAGKQKVNTPVHHTIAMIRCNIEVMTTLRAFQARTPSAPGTKVKAWRAALFAVPPPGICNRVWRFGEAWPVMSLRTSSLEQDRAITASSGTASSGGEPSICILTNQPGMR